MTPRGATHARSSRRNRLRWMVGDSRSRASTIAATRARRWKSHCVEGIRERRSKGRCRRCSRNCRIADFSFYRPASTPITPTTRQRCNARLRWLKRSAHPAGRCASSSSRIATRARRRSLTISPPCYARSGKSSCAPSMRRSSLPSKAALRPTCMRGCALATRAAR